MSNNKRYLLIDIVKGFSIFLMLWGHCIQYCCANSSVDFFENYVFKCIYSFHMPLFMLVSGYLFFYSFSKRNLKDLLIHRTQSLLQPIVFCSIFNYLMTTVLLRLIKGDFTAVFDGKWIFSLSSLWFLWSVLAASLVTTIVCKKCNHLIGQITLLVAAIPIIAMFPNMTLNLYMYPYFILGFYFSKYRDTLPKTIHNLKYVSLILFPILLAFYDKKHYIYTTGLFPSDRYPLTEILFIDAYRWLIGLVGSVFVITVLQFIYEHPIFKHRSSILSKALAHVGKRSLQFYTLSVPFLSTYLSIAFPKMLSLLKIDNIFVVLIAIMVMISIRWIGILLINSLLILPAASRPSFIINSIHSS